MAKQQIETVIDKLKNMELPFRIDLLPINFPNPSELILNVEKN